MVGVVEKLNPRKPDALSMKRDAQRGNKRGWTVQSIDMPQACKVGPWSDMRSIVSLLRRDIVNVLQYFKKYGIRRNPDEILDVFLSEYVPQNQKHYAEEVAPI